jgi:hypothetical protein
LLIQDRQSQLYLAPRGSWTNQLTEADDFIVTTIAYNLGRQMTAGPLQVLLHIDETNELIPFMEGMGRGAA